MSRVTMRNLAIFCTLLSLTGAGTAQITITGTTRQVTTNTLPQIDPAISGNIVVYTDQQNGDNDDVYFTDLSTSSETQVTTSVGPQRLNDVSGTRIVYTDLTFTFPNRTIFLYDTSTGSTTQASFGPVDQNPRIDGQIVAFERGLGTATDVWAVNLATMEEIPIATGNWWDLNPVVSGTRVLYQSHATTMPTTTPSQIVLFDLATRTSTPLSVLPNDSRRPDIDGNLVVWDVLSLSGDTDIAVHNLATHTTQVLALPGNQHSPHISGRFVSFDDDSSGDPNIILYHVDSGQFFPVTTEASSDFLNDISGNRVVFTSNRAGNNDIWVYEFHVQPALQVTPTALHFGSVNTGSSQSQIFTLTNLENVPAAIQSVGFAGGANGFSVPSLALPASVPPGGSLDITVAFSPVAAGAVNNTLQITCNVGPVQVALDGLGVSTMPPPQQQIAAILAFFDASVSAGTLAGSGPGNSATGRRNALRNMLDAAGDLIQQGRLADACQQLQDALNRTDGNTPPPDFVAGSAAAELAQRIQTLRTTLGCA